MAAAAPGNGDVPRRAVRAVSLTSMSRFRERWNLGATTSDIVPLQLVGRMDEVTFYSPDNIHVAGDVMATCLSMLTNDNTNIEKCALYLSAMCCMCTDLKATAVSVIRALGGRIVDRRLPSGAEEYFISMIPAPSVGKCLVWFAQLVFMLYKNVSEASYDNFMAKRIKALRAVVGLPPIEVVGEEEEVGDQVCSREEAAVFRSMLGAHPQLRREVLLRILEYTRLADIRGSMSIYVASILSWTDMSSMMFVFDVLLCSNSPVLYDARVSNEVRSLETAFKLVNKSSLPQYYRILGDPREMKLLERSRFPILLTVAQSYRSEQYRTISQFVFAMDTTGGVVRELLDLHKRYIHTATIAASASAIEYLTRTEGDPEDEDTGLETPARRA